VRGDRSTAAFGRNDDLRLMRTDLSARSEQLWRNTACPEPSGNRRGSVTCQRIRTAARGQVAAQADGAADDCEADDDGRNTFGERQHGSLDFSVEKAARQLEA
jgi:hypothetical protein